MGMLVSQAWAVLEVLRKKENETLVEWVLNEWDDLVTGEKTKRVFVKFVEWKKRKMEIPPMFSPNELEEDDEFKEGDDLLPFEVL
jgi:hypothetical protein